MIRRIRRWFWLYAMWRNDRAYSLGRIGTFEYVALDALYRMKLEKLQ